jgi:hypothetical protein
MMFKIDLLNGAGLPPRSHPLMTTVVTLAFVAIGVAAALDGVHVYDVTHQTGSCQQSIAMYDRQIAGLADVAKALDITDKRTREINAGLKETDQILGTHRAWSPLLLTLMNSATNGLTISEIVAKREEKKNAPQKGVYDYTLVAGVISPAGAAPVEAFIQTLRLTLPLQSGPDSIRPVSQKLQQIDGRDVQYYVIESRLKP